MSNIVKIFDAETLSAALKDSNCVLIDFWAEWCGPCRMLAPTVEEIAVEMQGKVTVGKLNIDENMDFAVGLGIISIPTLVLFRDGAEVGRLVGVQPKQTIIEMIRSAQE